MELAQAFSSDNFERLQRNVFFVPVVKRNQSFDFIEAKNENDLVAVDGERVGHVMKIARGMGNASFFSCFSTKKDSAFLALLLTRALSKRIRK